MQADTDILLSDEQVYNNYINNLSLRKAISNYIHARTYEPGFMLLYGFLLVLKTPSYLISPGLTSRCWKRYFLFFNVLEMKCKITKKELSLKIKQISKRSR